MVLIDGNDALNLNTAAQMTGTNGPCGTAACYTAGRAARSCRNCELSFADVLFLDASLNDLGVQAQNLAVTAVPEPAAYLLLAIGLAGLTAARRRTMK